MVITNFSLSNKDVLGKIPYLNQSGLNNLSNSGRLKRKKVLGVWMYCSYSVNSFLSSFNIDEYYTYSEVVNLLKEFGICDSFTFYGRSKKNTPMCVYKRKNSEFPLSVKNLIGYWYMEVLEDFQPILITKESVEETIKTFQIFGLNNKLYTKTPTSKVKPSNNDDYTSELLDDLMENVG